MAKISTTVQAVNDGAMFLVTKIDGNGKETVTTENSMASLGHKEIAGFLNQSFKGETTRRATHQSMLASVFANPKLDGYKGKGDPLTGKTSKEFKASIRACEDLFFTELQNEGLLKLPKSDNPEKTFQEFCTSVREDKNYSNIKSTVSKYYAFVGCNCITSSGFLIPAPVMLEQIKAVMQVEPADNSIYGKLNAIMTELAAGTLDEDDCKKSLIACRAIMSTLQGVSSHYAEIATNNSQALSIVQANTVPTIAKATIESAMKSVASTKVQVPALV